MEYFRYKNTNCFFIKSKGADDYLAVDAGWPCSLRDYQRALKAIGIQFKQIRYCMVTHWHMDHAGLISDFLELGIRCFMIGKQSHEEIEEMERIIRKNYKEYKEIDKGRLEMASIADINEFLAGEGFGVKALMTVGHSPDSISFITEEKEAIIGDLAPIEQVMEDSESKESWESIRRQGAKVAYPSHAPIFAL